MPFNFNSQRFELPVESVVTDPHFFEMPGTINHESATFYYVEKIKTPDNDIAGWNYIDQNGNLLFIKY
jgi:hypothetical protein